MCLILSMSSNCFHLNRSAIFAFQGSFESIMSHTEIVIILQFKGGITLAMGEVDLMYRALKQVIFFLLFMMFMIEHCIIQVITSSDFHYIKLAVDI